jgi:hypothetical protein
MIQPITLGELIEQLSKCNKTAHVYFDFCGLRPTGLGSYRGYYDQLALGWKEEGLVTVGDLLAECQSAIGQTYEGYKGGEFKMSKSTPVWAANYGRSDSTAIKKIENLGDYHVIIVTRYMK